MSDADVNNALIVGCLDNASPSGLVSTGNGITFNIQVSDAAHSIANVLSAVEDDTQGKEDVNNDPFSKDPLPETDTVYYMEIKRVNATTIEQRVYTTSDYSTTQLGTTIQNTESEVEGATGLRYLTIKLNTEVHNSDGYTGYIQNLKFWNGTTTTATDDKATLLTDSLGSSADMTNSGGTQNITGEIGKAWYTGTSGGYTYAGSTNADWAFMNTTDCKFSIAFWCKLASSGNAIADGDLILGTGNGESEISIALRCNGTGGSFGLHLYGSAEVIAAYSPSGYLEEDDNWHHYVVTWDQTIASSNMKIYKDGGTAITGNKVNDSTSTSSPAHVFSLGGGLGNDFKGNFDEVSVWNRVLTSSEVDFLYDNDGGGTAQVTTDMADLTRLKAYWNLDATSGTYENNFAKSLLPENTLFEETDTYKTYWLQSNAWTINDPTRGVACMGDNNGNSEVYDFVTIATLGNATDFGDCTSPARFDPAACADATRGVCFGGGISASQNIIEYITVATEGNATDFGDMTAATRHNTGMADATYGLSTGGYTSSVVNSIDYVTIQTLGNAQDFGDLSDNTRSHASCADATRGLVMTGYRNALTLSITYLTIASTGNSTTFGDVTVARQSAAGCADATRGICGGGVNGSQTNLIDYVTIQTTGNATDFGDMTVNKAECAAYANALRGCFAGGNTGSITDVIEYVTIQTKGIATDFGGVITEARRGCEGLSA